MGGGFVHRPSPSSGPSSRAMGSTSSRTPRTRVLPARRRHPGGPEDRSQASSPRSTGILADTRDLDPRPAGLPENQAAYAADRTQPPRTVDAADLSPERARPDRRDVLRPQLRPQPRGRVRRDREGLRARRVRRGALPGRERPVDDRKGTRALVDALAADVDGEVRTSTVVEAIRRPATASRSGPTGTTWQPRRRRRGPGEHAWLDRSTRRSTR